MGEIKGTNFRIDEDIADDFRKWCKDNDMVQDEGFRYLMNQVALDHAKTIVPGRAVEIETFQKEVADLTKKYLDSIEIYKNEEARVSEHFNAMLETLNKQIKELEQGKSDLEKKLAEAEQASENSVLTASRAEKEAAVAKEQAETAAKLAAEKDRTISTLAEKLAVCEKKAASYDELKAANEKAQAELFSVKKDHEIEIRELKAELDRKLSEAAKDAEIDKMQALSASEKENARLMAKIEILETQLNKA